MGVQIIHYQGEQTNAINLAFPLYCKRWTSPGFPFQSYLVIISLLG
jgi:hypothetical protein